MAFYIFIKPPLYTFGNRERKFLRIPIFLWNNVLPGRPALAFPDEVWIVPHCSRSFCTEVVVYTPLHQSIIFQSQVSMSESSRNVHLLLVFKGQHRTVCVTEGFSRSEVNCYIENRTVQTGYQLCLGVFTFLIMQTSQCELFSGCSPGWSELHRNLLPTQIASHGNLHIFSFQ